MLMINDDIPPPRSLSLSLCLVRSLRATASWRVGRTLEYLMRCGIASLVLIIIIITITIILIIIATRKH